MGEEIPVFDAWGKEVGKFVPTGSGFGDTILMMITLIILWTIGFAIYLFIKLIVKGLKAASKKRWEEAVTYLAIPGLLIFFAVISLISGVAIARAEQHEREQYSLEVAQEAAWAKAHADDMVTITRVAGTETIFERDSTRKRWLLVEYQITNNLNYFSVEVSEPIDAPFGMCQDDARGTFWIGSGETATIHCGEYFWNNDYWVRYNSCLNIQGGTWSDGPFGGQYCLENLIPSETGDAASFVGGLELYLATKSCNTSPCNWYPRLHMRTTTSSSLDERWPLGLRLSLDGKDRHSPFVIEENVYWPIFFSSGASYTLYDNGIGKGDVGGELCLEVSYPYTRSGTICRRIPVP